MLVKIKGKLHGISLFSGYAGIDLALADYIRPLLYCEIERYAQGILLSRMEDESIPFAPIWGDVRTLDGNQFKGLVNIIYGGFPCQDISNAGKGRGLEGERSGLFYEVVRICQEASPEFIFLENVAGIRLRGSIEVSETLAGIGYDCRFGMLSAAEVGANHQRDRYFCLAIRRDLLSNPNGHELREQPRGSSGKNRESEALIGNNGQKEPMANSVCERFGGQAITSQEENNKRIWESNGRAMSTTPQCSIREGEISESQSIGIQGLRASGQSQSQSHDGKEISMCQGQRFSKSHWEIEPELGRVVDGVANRVDRVKALGNGVVPLQVKTAFEILIGIK